MFTSGGLRRASALINKDGILISVVWPGSRLDCSSMLQFYPLMAIHDHLINHDRYYLPNRVHARSASRARTSARASHRPFLFTTVTLPTTK